MDFWAISLNSDERKFQAVEEILLLLPAHKSHLNFSENKGSHKV